MLWSSNQVLDDVYHIKGPLREEAEIKVLLKLNSVKDEAMRLPYKVKDSQTIVVEGKAHSQEQIIGQNLKLFRVDQIFNPGAQTEDTTSSIIGDSVAQLFNGYNVAIMAYGQTDSGKTSTMFGYNKGDGVINGVCKQIFTTVETGSENYIDYSVCLSIIEVYCESIKDLLAPPSEQKPLKLRLDSKKSSISIKNLRCVYVTSLLEALSYCEKAQSLASSRSSVIIRITVEQRDNVKEVFKTGSFQLVDLGSSDKVDKQNDLGISPENTKKINQSMVTLENVARSLAGTEQSVKNGRPRSGNYYIPYKESCLTQLLQETIGGNCKTTLVLMCSTAKQDEAETLNTLNFGANMKLVKNIFQQNKAGTNSKAMLDLLMKDFDAKEKNYQSHIQLLEKELMYLKKPQYGETADKQNEIILENKKLKAQLESLSQLLHNSSSKANVSSKNDEEHSKIMGILMEKCEKVMEVQMKLDNEISCKKSLTSQLEFKSSKEEALTAMNLKLLEQLQANEEEMKDLLASNLHMRQDLEKWSNLANSRFERIGDLESMLREVHVSKLENPAARRLSSSSAGSAKSQLDESSQSGKLSWFFKNTTPNAKASRKISINSVSSKGSEDSSRIRSSRTGLNLHAVRLNEGITDADSLKSK